MGTYLINMQNTLFEPLVLTGLYTTISLKVGTK